MTFKDAATSPVPAWVAAIITILPLITAGFFAVTDRAEAWGEIRATAELAHENKIGLSELRRNLRDQDTMTRWLVWNAGGDPNKIISGNKP